MTTQTFHERVLDLSRYRKALERTEGTPKENIEVIQRINEQIDRLSLNRTALFKALAFIERL